VRRLGWLILEGDEIEGVTLDGEEIEGVRFGGQGD